MTSHSLRHFQVAFLLFIYFLTGVKLLYNVVLVSAVCVCVCVCVCVFPLEPLSQPPIPPL